MMSTCGVCQNARVKQAINNCHKILSTYAWLVDAYVLDFFTEELWKKLPQTWQDVLFDIDTRELGLWLDQDKIPRYRRPWPLSLLALRSSVHLFSLPRKKTLTRIHYLDVDHANRTLHDCKGNFSQSCDNTMDCQHGPGSCKHVTFTEKNNICRSETCFEDIKHPGFLQAFQKHVKPKKRHEIFRMAKVICEWADKMEVKHVVDVGSGLGHLARLLTYGHNLSTCCIESQPNLSSAARKLDVEMEYTLSKYLTQEELAKLCRPQHITHNLGPTIDSADFMKLFSKAFSPENTSDVDEVAGFGIVGLHPCGDLAATLLQLFIACPQAKFICIAGCCYMKLTPQIGFPLSKHSLKEEETEKNFRLSYEAREMACHAIETYAKNLLSENSLHLKIHCFRATLEAIIAKNWPHLRRSGLKSIKYSQGLQFSDYAKSALSPLGLNPPEEDIESSSTRGYLNIWRHVVVFYSLRLMLAPLVETFLLYDRLLYLYEKGMRCQITPEFDPEISPRNHLLIGSKPFTTYMRKT